MGCLSPNLLTEKLFSQPLDEITFMRASGDRLQQSGEAQKKDALKKVEDSFILLASSLPLGPQVFWEKESEVIVPLPQTCIACFCCASPQTLQELAHLDCLEIPKNRKMGRGLSTTSV